MKSNERVRKKNGLLIVVVIAYLATLAYDYINGSGLFVEALALTGSYLKEMLQVMPPVLILTALIATWVPREIISANLGVGSGLRGKLASVAIGSISAGPIYAAFPVAQTLLDKGASIGNVVIIISSWAVIKIPMLAVETRFLGAQFTLARYLWTVPSILAMGAICNKVLCQGDLKTQATKANVRTIEQRILEELPGYHCKACGFESCTECANAIARGEAELNACIPGGNDVTSHLTALMKRAKHDA